MATVKEIIDVYTKNQEIKSLIDTHLFQEVKMPKILITVSELQKEFLEQKAEECGCSEEEFIDILISRDMETDCRYIHFGSEGAECGLDGDCCEFFSLDGITGPEWLKGHECEKAIDHKGDISDLDKQRGI